MPTQPTATSRAPVNTGSSFFQRLGYYALGIAIGLMILGMITVARQRQAAARNASQSAPAVSPQSAPTAR